MALDTQTGNLVMAHLGHPSITSIDDNVEPARRLKALYPPIRRKVITDGEWPFAIRRTELSAILTEPDFGWTHQCTLPSDFLRPIAFPDISGDDFAIEGGMLLINQDSAQLIYVADIDSPTDWTPDFQHVLSLALAATLCASTTGSESRRMELWDQYSRALGRATATAAKSRRPKTLTMSELVDASRGFTAYPSYP
jgi:hypothetical protein